MHTEQDEQAALALVEDVERQLLAVLERVHQVALEAGSPRFGRWTAIHATTSVLGRLMLSAIDLEHDARPHCARILDQLTLYISPTSERPS